MTSELTHESPAAAPPSVLVVDDEVELARVVARGLTHAGYQVSVAHDGLEALALLAGRRFDLLLTDVNMPQMTGIELQQTARGADPDLAVILITAAQDAKDAVTCMREGVFDYIIKPAALADVAVRVANALERRRLVLENRGYQLNLEQRVVDQADRIRRLLLKSLEGLSHALEAKDENTRNHSSRVVTLASALAERLRPEDAEFRSKLRLAALFHDIGKIGVPEAILNKPGKLTPEEVAQIQKHPVTGEGILRPLLEGEEEILAVVRHHHERWDGGGYPDGLVAEQTPLGARIVAVADAYDAMTSSRPYRPGMSLEQALQILQDGAGSQWDPEVVAAMLDLAEEEQFHPRTHATPAAMGTPGPRHDGTLPLRSPTATQRPVIFVRDHLDAKAAGRLQVKVEALLSRGRNDIVLDMEQVRALDPDAVQLLYRMHLRVQEHNGIMTIRDATSPALTLFREAKIAEILTLGQSSRTPSAP